MALQKEYVEDLREKLSAEAFKSRESFLAECQPDLRAGYWEEVDHLGKSIFGREFRIRK